jgi:hypothetical protein
LLRAAAAAAAAVHAGQDTYTMVGLEGFNDDATETKGISLFAINLLAASPDTTTDEEVDDIRSLVAHEYFHNWSGRDPQTADCRQQTAAVWQDLYTQCP